jgi:uncharacterized protein (DUF433 family)
VTPGDLSPVDGQASTRMPTEKAPRVVVDPGVRFGKPVIQGTRVPVHLVISKLAEGMKPEEIAEEYGITLEDIQAALSYAASVLATKELRATE